MEGILLILLIIIIVAAFRNGSSLNELYMLVREMAEQQQQMKKRLEQIASSSGIKTPKEELAEARAESLASNSQAQKDLAWSYNPQSEQARQDWTLAELERTRSINEVNELLGLPGDNAVLPAPQRAVSTADDLQVEPLVETHQAERVEVDVVKDEITQPAEIAQSATVEPERTSINSPSIDSTSTENASTGEALQSTDLGEQLPQQIVPEAIANKPLPGSIQSRKTSPQKASASRPSTSWQDHEEFDVKTGGVVSSIFKWFLQGNPLAKVGMLLLFFGLSYLLKYSVDHNVVSIELRFIGAAFICLVLLGLGWYLRKKSQLYALILQGGAIGGFYITTFASFKLYELVPHLLAFSLILIVCAGSVGLAVLQRALSLAVVASIGGYLAPILLSTGSNNYVGLFSYYLMLSCGILAISIWQSWRILNLIAFAFTYVVAITWGVFSYQPENYLFCQILLLANMAVFGILTILSSLRSARDGHPLIDGTLFFGTAIVSFGMQYVMTQDWEFGPAFSALGFGLFYLFCAWYLLRYWRQQSRYLVTGALALGAGFVTLAIPLALSAQWTSLGWLLLGLSVLWSGLQQGQRRFSWGASAIIVMGACSAIYAYQTQPMNLPSFIMVFGLLSMTFLTGGGLWQHFRLVDSGWQRISQLFLVTGILSWLFWLVKLSQRLVDYEIVSSGFAAYMLCLSLMMTSVLIWRKAAQKTAWKDLQYAAWLLWPALLITSLALISPMVYFELNHLLWLPLLVLAYGIGYFMLRQDGEALWSRDILCGLHISLFLSALLSLGQILHWTLSILLPPVAEIYWMANVIIVSLAVIVVMYLDLRGCWPVSQNRQWYVLFALAPVVVCLFLLMIIGNFYSAFNEFWYYLPLINPLELSALLGFVALSTWLYRGFNSTSTVAAEIKDKAEIALYLLIAFWINGVLIRILAYYGEIPWDAYSLWNSRLVQAGMAICWTFGALICMLRAGQKENRQLWFCGAGLLLVVLLKLFLIDSSNSGGLIRAIAFICVAILILIVGYFTPLPPKALGEEKKAE